MVLLQIPLIAAGLLGFAGNDDALAAQPCAAPYAVRARGDHGSEVLRTLGSRFCVPPPRD